jgi:DNA polymerase-1
MMMTTHPKVPTKKRRSIWSFGSGVSDESSEENHHKYYKTLQDTEHSYQIIQGDLGLKLLLQNLSKQSSVCFDTETRTRCLACRVSRDFSLMKGKGFTYPFRESGWSKALAEKFMPFRKRKNRKIGQNLKYDLKILSNYGINVEGKLLTPWLLII